MTADALPEILGTNPNNSDRLESQIFKDLFDKIRFGEFALGQRLPSEMDLSEEYGVSRPVVREALSKLRDSGLITSRKGAGSFVSSDLPTVHKGYGPLSSINDIASYFAFRRTIESEAAALAARNATKAGVARLRDTVEEMEKRVPLGGEGIRLDIKFHLIVAELSDSRFLHETIELIQPHWDFVGKFVRSLGNTRPRTGRRMLDEHRRIVQAIADGNESTARKMMVTHIEGSESRVFKGQ